MKRPSAHPAAVAADAYFQQGLNCAQSVVRAVMEHAGLEGADAVASAALAMGGGIGRTGKACGAMTGAVMAVGLAADRHTPGDLRTRKHEAYRLAGDLVRQFTEACGGADCATILGFSWNDAGAAERARRENVHVARCTPCVRWAAAEAARLIDALRKTPPPMPRP
jgi:C_GCAxxG_C_C family probable redox protein